MYQFKVHVLDLVKAKPYETYENITDRYDNWSFHYYLIL